MSASKAIVTLALGAGFRERWERLCAPGWRAYAQRHGYDVVVLDQPLDISARAAARSPAWQKCLVLGQPFAERYDRVVWVDADVMINPEAPCIASAVPAGRVGAVDEYAIPTREAHADLLAKLYRHWDATATRYVHNPRPRDYYEIAGLPAFDQVVQTGVMVLEPALHCRLLEETYHGHEDLGAGWNYEMRPLSCELLKAGVVDWLDPRFNYLWGIYKALHQPHLVADPAHPRAAEAVRAALADAHFLHFAGSAAEMAAVPPAAPRPKAPAVGRRPQPAPPTATPVLLLMHRRPDTTAQVLDAIRTARPSRLLVAADGPRDAADAELCERTRALVDTVDWPCDVETSFAAGNLGLKRRVESALDWAFDRAEELIVLEDDCVPHPSFFRYCAELLERFRDDDRVLSVCGSDFAWRDAPAHASYRFSRYPLIWGWASWRRAWRDHDPDMERWPAARDAGQLEQLFGDPRTVAYWTHVLDRTMAERDTWDYPWALSGWLRDGLHVLPTTNLVSNVGFRADATHTTDQLGIFAGLPAREMAFPLRHPAGAARDEQEDAALEELLFSGNVTRMLKRVRAARRALAVGT